MHEFWAAPKTKQSKERQSVREREREWILTHRRRPASPPDWGRNRRHLRRPVLHHPARRRSTDSHRFRSEPRVLMRETTTAVDSRRSSHRRRLSGGFWSRRGFTRDRPASMLSVPSWWREQGFATASLVVSPLILIFFLLNNNELILWSWYSLFCVDIVLI